MTSEKSLGKTGAISLAATFRINVGIESGPVALYGLRFCSNLAIHFVLIVMFDIGGCGLWVLIWHSAGVFFCIY